MSTQKATPVIILGMHRSGTSCLAGTLQQAGVCLGKVSKFNEFNKKGNRENLKAMQLNNKILEYNHGNWQKPPKKIIWEDKHEKEGMQLIKEFEQNCDSRYWGFKDPRVLLTLPFWKKLLPPCRYVGTYRNPANVAQSLIKRDSEMEMNAGLQLWSYYNTQLLNFYQEAPFPLISFDLAPTDYRRNMKRVCVELGLPETEHIDFFDNTLRSHQTTVDPMDSHPDIRDLYHKLGHISMD